MFCDTFQDASNTMKKAHKYIYPIYISFLILVFVLNKIDTKEMDLSRWLPCSVVNKIELPFNDVNIDIYEVRSVELYSIAELFHCIKKQPNQYDIFITSHFPKLKLIECYESAYCHDLKDSENSILMQNRKLVIYKMSDNTLLIHCISYENLDITEPIIVNSIIPLSYGVKITKSLKCFFASFIMLFLLIFHPFILTINKYPLKHIAISLILYLIPFYFIFLFNKKIDILFFIIASNLILILLFQSIKLMAKWAVSLKTFFKKMAQRQK